MSNTSYASLVRNGQLNQQSVQGGYGGHHQRNRRLNKRNTAFRNDNHRRDDDVITGSGRNSDICASETPISTEIQRSYWCVRFSVTKDYQSCRCRTACDSCVRLTFEL